MNILKTLWSIRIERGIRFPKDELKHQFFPEFFLSKGNVMASFKFKNNTEFILKFFGTFLQSLVQGNRENKLESFCSACDWERSGLLEENPQSGCSDICASLKGPL